MGGKLFSDYELGEAIRAGKGTAEIAQEFGVTPRAVQKRAKQHRINVAREVAFSQTAKVVQQGLNEIDLLQKSCEAVTKLLALLRTAIEAEDADSRHQAVLELQPLLGDRPSVLEATVKIAAEMRQIAKQTFDMRKDLYELQELQEVLRITFEVIGRADSQTRTRIIDALKESAVLRHAVGWS